MSLQNKNVLCEKFYERFSKIYKAFYSFGLIPKEICEIMCKLLDIKETSYYKYLKRCRETNKINTTFKGERDRMVKRMNNKEPIKADEDIRELITKALSDEVIDNGDEQISMFADGPKGPTTNSIDDCPTIKITPDQILEVAKTSAKTYDITGSICQESPITSISELTSVSPSPTPTNTLLPYFIAVHIFLKLSLYCVISEIPIFLFIKTCDNTYSSVLFNFITGIILIHFSFENSANCLSCEVLCNPSITTNGTQHGFRQLGEVYDSSSDIAISIFSVILVKSSNLIVYKYKSLPIILLVIFFELSPLINLNIQ